MNGVLGLLALVRQHGLSGQQTRLLDQVELSGTQMIDLLKDILDFSALQDGQLKLDKKPFETRRLVDAVRGMFEPVALREGIIFEAVADDSCPERVIGDFGKTIGKTSDETAHAIMVIANELMIKAIGEITVNDGLNPR